MFANVDLRALVLALMTGNRRRIHVRMLERGRN
jgi:hypothetical protein